MLPEAEILTISVARDPGEAPAADVMVVAP
jgi:hypothetical protein